MNLRLILTIFILVKDFFFVIYCQDFSYAGPMGPEHWADEYSSCNGKHQSPININSLNVISKNYKDLEFSDFNAIPLEGHLINNGHTVLVRFRYDKTPTISKGPLGSEIYAFKQLHFHWGTNNLEGSEDRINNKSFPAELHMVFSNTRYENFDVALKQNNGIAVLAFFFQILPNGVPLGSRTYENLTLQLDQIQKPNTSAVYQYPPSLHSISSSAEIKEYYTYIGSLTTPPCSEDVIWIDFDVPILLTEEQIDRFRHLTDFGGEPLNHNFRPIQPLNNRKVFYVKTDSPLNTKAFTKAVADWSKTNKFLLFTCSFLLIWLPRIFLL